VGGGGGHTRGAALFRTATNANPLSRLAQIDLAQIVFFHQLYQSADAVDLEHVRAGFRFTHLRFPWFRRWLGGDGFLPDGAASGIISVGHGQSDG